MTQCTPGPALREALGLPDLDDDVFPSRSAGTQHVLHSLRQFLRCRQLHDHMSSPTALWGLLHDGIMPASLTWGRLVGHSTLATLLDRLARKRNSQRPRLLCWNLRRLVDPEPQVAKQKTRLPTSLHTLWKNCPHTGNTLVSPRRQRMAQPAGNHPHVPHLRGPRPEKRPRWRGRHNRPSCLHA